MKDQRNLSAGNQTSLQYLRANEWLNKQAISAIRWLINSQSCNKTSEWMSQSIYECQWRDPQAKDWMAKGGDIIHFTGDGPVSSRASRAGHTLAKTSGGMGSFMKSSALSRRSAAWAESTCWYTLVFLLSTARWKNRRKFFEVCEVEDDGKSSEEISTVIACRVWLSGEADMEQIS